LLRSVSVSSGGEQSRLHNGHDFGAARLVMPGQAADHEVGRRAAHFVAQE
jgi:hypothetical protein